MERIGGPRTMKHGTIRDEFNSEYTGSKDNRRPSWCSRGCDRKKSKETKGRKKGVAGERVRRWGFPRGSFSFFRRNFLQNAPLLDYSSRLLC